MVSRDGYVSTEEEKRRKEQRVQAAVRVVWYAKIGFSVLLVQLKKKSVYSKRSIYETLFKIDMCVCVEIKTET